jgi:zinc transporter 9
LWFDPVWISGIVLLIALVVEAYVLRIAWLEYVSRLNAPLSSRPLSQLMQCKDPTLLAVLLEDAIAVTGVVLAAAGIMLARTLDNPLWDISMSVVIAVMLGVAAVVLGRINMRFLSDIRDIEAENIFAEVVEIHREVERCHDVRSIVIDEQHTVLVAEVEVREEMMLAGLRQEIDRHEQFLLERVSPDRRSNVALLEYIADRSVVEATLERTEHIIDQLEKALRERCPRISHVTIEVQGIVEDSSE